MAKNVTRLFKTLAPAHYDIATSISVDKKTFTGSTTLVAKKTGRPSKRITLHQKDLKFSHIELSLVDEKSNEKINIPIKRTVIHKKFDEIRIHTDQLLYPKQYEITLHYSGKITPNMEGIYPCDFQIEGADKQLIATQFESHHAREVFPCIDEPEAKATFKLTLTHAKGEVALSNTPVESEQAANEDAQRITTFEKTPTMSTYLVAFVVGELHYRETTSKNGVKIRTYAVANQIEHSEFALDVAAKAMDFYEDYYDIRFPLPKCDFVALPDFASGAMENWGLITFREQTLLCDKNTSLGTKQYVAIVVAHELTHQWFGNLVTMKWWTDLWLNEGFASWMEYLAVDSLFPEWNLWTQFSVDEHQLALKVDGLEHTHPVEVPVHHPDEIRTIFDSISYQKGASVIHMLHSYLGADDFKKGLRHYLKTFAYKNTVTSDLWKSLEEVTHKPVLDLMHQWISQSGFPLVRASLEQNLLTLSQQKFVLNPKSMSRNDNTLWRIPLLSNQLEVQEFTKRELHVQYKKQSEPLLLNTKQRGFYRVAYQDSLQDELITLIDAGTLGDIDRMALLSDSLEVTKAGYQSINSYLELLSHYKSETTLPVWEIIAQSLGAVRHILSSSDNDDSLRDAMKPFIKDLTSPQLKRLGWTAQSGENHLDTLLRPLIIALNSSADEKETIETLKALYKKRIQGDDTVDPDLRATIYTTAVRFGGQKEFDELLSLYQATMSSDEKLSITAGMTSFESPDLHAQVLALLKTKIIRMQDIGYWLAYSFMNRHSRVMTWQWLQEHWGWLQDNLGNDLSFYRMPVYAARNFSTDKFKDEYSAFFTPLLSPTLTRSYNQGLEMIETNTAWRERDSKAALDWFKAQR